MEDLGTTRAERAAALATMVRNSGIEELDDAADLFERQLIRAAQGVIERDQFRHPETDRLTFVE